MVNVPSGNSNKNISPQALHARRAIIAGLCVTPVGFIIMMFNLMKVYDYAGQSCSEGSTCTDAVDTLGNGVHAGIAILLFGIACTLLGALAYFYYTNVKK